MWFLCRDQTQLRSRHKMKKAPKCPFLLQIGKPGFFSMSTIIYRLVWWSADCAGFRFSSHPAADMVSRCVYVTWCCSQISLKLLLHLWARLNFVYVGYIVSWQNESGRISESQTWANFHGEAVWEAQPWCASAISQPAVIGPGTWRPCKPTHFQMNPCVASYDMLFVHHWLDVTV